MKRNANCAEGGKFFAYFYVKVTKNVLFWDGHRIFGVVNTSWGGGGVVAESLGTGSNIHLSTAYLLENNGCNRGDIIA